MLRVHFSSSGGMSVAIFAILLLALPASTLALHNGEPHDIWLMPPVEEWPFDLNQDGRFDELRFNITLQVNVSWKYVFEGDLRALDSSFLGSDYVPVETYSVGTYVRMITIPGARMAWSGTDGPYRLGIFAWKVYETDHDVISVGVDSRAYVTSPYTASDFDPPYARLAKPFSDHLEEAAPDGPSDLVIRVHVAVERNCTLSVRGDILDPADLSPLDSYRYMRLVASPGPLSIDLVFNGTAFAVARKDGPYLVQVTMYVEENNFLNDTYYRTAAYNYSAFLPAHGPADTSPLNAIAVGTVSAAGGVGSVATFLLLRRHRRRRAVRKGLETEDLEPPPS